ncbi:EF-Tu C-terminal domain-related protein, partial [Acinetobacter baumannii]
LDFNVYSAFAIHALGENETIIEEIQNFKSPELVAMDPGLRFAIREGGRTVGAGVVAKVTA